MFSACGKGEEPGNFLVGSARCFPVGKRAVSGRFFVGKTASEPNVDVKEECCFASNLFPWSYERSDQTRVWNCRHPTSEAA